MKLPAAARRLYTLLLALAYAAAAVLLLLLAYRKLDAAAGYGAALASLFLSLALLFLPRRAVVAHATFFALFALLLSVVRAEWMNEPRPTSNLRDFAAFLLDPPPTTTDLHDFYWALCLAAPLVLLVLFVLHWFLHAAGRTVARRFSRR